MQFLAFLKDSAREARSGWMLQIMLVLSTLLILLVASIGFHPVTAGDLLATPLRLLTGAIKLDPQGYERVGKPTLSIENVVASDDALAWRSDYEFDYVIKCPDDDGMRKARRSGLPITPQAVRQFLRGPLRDFEKVEVDEPPPPPSAAAFLAVGGGALALDPPWAAAEVRYRVRARGNKVDDPLAWPHRVSALFLFDVPVIHVGPREGAYFIEKWLVSKLGAWVALLVSVIITAGFIPNMLAKGSLDLLVSKPIGRARLLIYKYLGGLLFVLFLAAFTAIGVWAAIGVRTGLWSVNFLAVIPLLTFYFAVLYSVSTFTAVLTRSMLASIIVTGIVWASVWLIGWVNDGVEERLEDEVALRAMAQGEKKPKGQDPEDVQRPLAALDPDAPLMWVLPRAGFPVYQAIHAVTPRTYQLDSRLGRVIAEGVLTPYQLKISDYRKPPRESWGEMLGVSAGFIALLLGLSCWRFSTRDF